MYIKQYFEQRSFCNNLFWVTLFWDVVNFVLRRLQVTKNCRSNQNWPSPYFSPYLWLKIKVRAHLALTKCFDIIKLVVTWILVNDILRRTWNFSRKLLLKFLLYLKLLHWIKRGEFIVWVEKNADMLIFRPCKLRLNFFWNFYSFILLDIKDYWMALKRVIPFLYQ